MGEEFNKTHESHSSLQAALEVFYGLGYIVGPMIGGILFSVSIKYVHLRLLVVLGSNIYHESRLLK